MDFRYSRELVVGTIVTVAILVFIVGTMWLSGRSVTSGNVVRIQFADVSGLKRASPVRVSGVNIGKVEEIEFLDVGKVLVMASLPSKIRPKVDAEAKIVSISLVGDYAVDFNPGDASQLLPAGKVILGMYDPGLTGRAMELSDRADSILIGAQAIVNKQTAEQLRSTLVALEGTLKAAQRTMQIYSDSTRGPTAELTRTMVAFRQLSTRLDSTLANPALGRTLTRTDTLTANLAAMTARFDSTLAAINRGQGTLGKLATDSGLYTDMREVTSSMKELLDELKKNPGKVGVTVKLF
jgi:phospholipid/cholesterol/gamma-HCH transport system substrate-binding protein